MRHGSLCLLLGLASLGLAPLQGGWVWLLAWLAVDFVLLGVADLGAGPRVLGESADGRLPLWSKPLFGPYLVCSTVLWFVETKLSGEHPYDEVAPGLFVGRRLLTHELPDGIVNWVDLTAEFADAGGSSTLPVRLSADARRRAAGRVRDLRRPRGAAERRDRPPLCPGPRPVCLVRAAVAGSPRRRGRSGQRACRAPTGPPAGAAVCVPATLRRSHAGTAQSGSASRLSRSG